MELHLILGFVGDFLTFLSGGVLAWDAVYAEKEFVAVTEITEGLAGSELKGIEVNLGGKIVENATGVERFFRRQTSRKATIGCILLGVGFAVLLAARIAEFVNH